MRRSYSRYVEAFTSSRRLIFSMMRLPNPCRINFRIPVFLTNRLRERLGCTSGSRARLALYLRAHTVVLDQPKRCSSKGRITAPSELPKWPDHAVVFGRESRTDITQELTFGFYRILRLNGDTYVLVEEGIRVLKTILLFAWMVLEGLQHKRKPKPVMNRIPCLRKYASKTSRSPNGRCQAR
jgi:hypothetical protein